MKSAEEADSVAGVKVRRFPAFLLDTSGSRELLRQGPLVLTVRCRMDGADQVAEVIVQTAQNAAAVYGRRERRTAQRG